MFLVSPGRCQGRESGAAAKTTVSVNSLRLAQDVLAVLGACVAAVAWFTTGRVSVGTGTIAALVALGLFVRIAVQQKPESLYRMRRPRFDTLVVCSLAALLRLPALVEPLGFVGADGSLQAFLVHRLLAGDRPAPVFLDSSSYEGSLKAHVAALIGFLTNHDDWARLLVFASLLLWFVLIAATMSLGRRVGGNWAGVCAGLFVALSGRFVTTFSVSNAGPYPDALALGTWSLAWTAALLHRNDAISYREYFGIGVLLGVAFWQQPIVISYAAVTVSALLIRALADKQIGFLALAPGLFLGRLPATLYDLAAQGAAKDVVASFASGAGQGLPLIEQIGGTLTWAFPVVFFGLQGETTLSAWTRGIVGALCFALMLWFGFRERHAFRGLWSRKNAVAGALPLLHFAVALALVWLVAGEGQYSRPRYFLPLVPSFAVAFGALVAAIGMRSRLFAVLVAAIVIGTNATSSTRRLREGIEAGSETRKIAARLESLGLRHGYADFSISGPLTMATRERVTITGELGPMSGEHLQRQTDLVARSGADFFITKESEIDAFSHRLRGLGVGYELLRDPLPIFYKLSRRVALDEVRDFRER